MVYLLGIKLGYTGGEELIKKNKQNVDFSLNGQIVRSIFDPSTLKTEKIISFLISIALSFNFVREAAKNRSFLSGPDTQWGEGG